jgi:integrase/recombinase XerD
MPGMPALRVTDWHQLVGEFFDDRRAHGLKERSLEFYQYGAERLLIWTAESGITPADFASRHLRAFLAWLQMSGSRQRDWRRGQRLAPRTLHAYSRVVRALLYFGAREGMLEAAPVMEMPKVPKPDPDYLREDEVERLRGACRKPRDRALFELMLDSGLRRGEVSRLTWGDLMPDAALVRVRVRHGKGDKPRVTYCTLQTWRLLCEWRAPGDPRAAVFGLTAPGLRMALRRLGDRAGVKLHPHMTRHTAIRRWLKRGMPVNAAQRMAGHSTSQLTIDLYGSASDADTAEAFLSAIGKTVCTPPGDLI